MAHKHLFRHPVGIFPARARWYLAGISMLALLLVAAHFAIQVHTQDLARATVRQWLGRSGGSVERVRFHLLRNALTLHGVRLKSGDMSLSIPEVLLYGRVDSLLGGRPSLSRVTMTAPRLQLPEADALRLLASEPGSGDTMFDQIWRLARHLEIQGGALELSAGQAGGRHWVFDGLNLLIRDEPGGRSVRGGFSYRGSRLALQSRMQQVAGGAEGDVSVSWDRLDGRAVAGEIMGLAPLSGEISGQMQWRWRTDAAGALMRSHLEGGMRVVTGALVIDDASVVPSLNWQADQADGRWQARVSAQAWSLAPFRGLAPVWYGRSLVSGRFSGVVDARWADGAVQAGRFRIASGGIRDLDYAPAAWPGDAETRPDWRVDRIDLTDVALDLDRHACVIGKLGLAGGEIRLTPGRADASAAPAPWNLEIRQTHIERLALALVFADGRPMLRTLPLSGQAQLIGSAFQCQLGASDAPVRWKIAGQGRWPWPADAAIRLDVDAAGLSLTQLRAVLPFAEAPRTGSAVDLEGHAGFALAVNVAGSQWTASGSMSARDVAMSWQGDSWRAAQVDVDLDKVGSGLPVQALRRVQASSWQYQGALQSLTPDAAAGGTGDILPPLRGDTQWRIDAMTWQGGTISFGRADAVWGSNVGLKLSDWADGQMAPLEFSGDIDGGTFDVTGAIGRFDGVLRADIKGKVASARPFFLNEWLQISGAPRIIRGRWASRFTWRADGSAPGHGRMWLWLSRWQVESGVFPNDPFLARTGFGAHDLARRLDADHLARIDVDYVQPGTGAVAWSDLGDALLAAMRKNAESSGTGPRPAPGGVRMETRIRLHGKAGLSHNERARLRRLWRLLAADKHLVVDMLPQLGNQDPDGDLVSTIRHTQDMIARFMTERGIPRRRLFPVWPTQANRGQGSLGIRVEVRHP